MKFYRILSSALLVPTITLLGATTASAAKVQAAFQVTSSVSGACSVSVAELNLGVYSGKQIDLASSINVNCTKGTTYQIGLDNGLHYSAPNRRLKHDASANYLIYDLYRDAGRTARWGDDEASSIHLTGKGATQFLNVYGRVPAGQRGPVGSYSNTTTVTVNF